ncbi:MAG: tRNA (N(6)-L-threonylcarbamoyladenosine(37)-C(2))-methylthiotransferase MtaB [Hyphomicrobiales bacterium]|nr:tRNA (N(6)-L-threonylcarbamoyladenosine(37)-C(2))-methylthiotransferase MtaB [Hyphomicrobiales bacterium]
MPEGEASIEVVTFGCRLNIVESEAMRSAARAAGERDLVIINSCAVTAGATRDAGRAVRRIARERPGAFIAVTGCAAQTEPQRFLAMPSVDRVIANDAKTLPETWAHLRYSDSVWIDAPPGGHRRRRAETPEGFEGHTRSFLQIQNGCDHSCTFCIIPRGRGPSRSSLPDAIIADARRAVAHGAAEIVLTGVDLTSWGHDLPGGLRLGGLVQALLDAVPDLARLRLSSLDCIEIDDDLLEAMAHEPRLMPHVHLSLQAGDDLILKRMKRRHSRAQAIELCARLRALRPDMALSADLIAGFPTESEAMFQNTLALVEDCGLASLHVFPFSPRPGTPAALMPAVHPEEVRERARRLRVAGDAAAARHRQARIGTKTLLLMERGGVGRMPDFTKVQLAGQQPGALVPALVTHEADGLLHGQCADVHGRP